MESQLRRGATFCRRVAVVILVVGFAGTMAVARALNGGWGEGLSLPALLASMAGLILVVLLFVALFLMVARMMEGLAEVVGRGVPPAGPPVAEGPVEGAGQSASPAPGPAAAPSPEGAGRPAMATDLSHLSPLSGVTEHIWMGSWVKVTVADGWTGWVREADLPVAPPAPVPRTKAGLPYRPPGLSLSPGRMR